MAKRGYNPYPIEPDPEHPQRGVHKITCTECGVYDTIATGPNHGLPTQVIAKKFGQRNWDVDTKNMGHGVCGACQRAAKEAKKKAKPVLTLVKQASQEEPVAEKPKPIVISHTPTATTAPIPVEDLIKPKAEPPKAMDLDAMLLILDAVESNYDPKTGYKHGCSDQQIATSLNCPVDWVRQVRTKKFGNLPETPEIVEVRRAIQKIDERIEMLSQSIDFERKTLEARIEKFRNTCLDSLSPLQARVQSLKTQQDDLHRILNDAIGRMNG